MSILDKAKERIDSAAKKLSGAYGRGRPSLQSPKEEPEEQNEAEVVRQILSDWSRQVETREHFIPAIRKEADRYEALADELVGTSEGAKYTGSKQALRWVINQIDEWAG